jgi:TPR repeat protein
VEWKKELMAKTEPSTTIKRADAALRRGNTLERRAHGTADLRAAFREYLQAAKLGNADGQFRVARCYSTGTGVRENDREAYKWWVRAASQGHEGAKHAVADSLFWGNGVEINRRLATRMYREGAATDRYFAFAWACCLWSGEGTRNDPKGAVKLFEQLVLSRHLKWPLTAAYLYLGYAHEKGAGVRKNVRTAAAYFQKAARLGWSDAMVNLGWMLYNGAGVEANPRRAVYWYKRAAKLNDSTAQVNLALAYIDGRGVRRSVQRATALLETAAADGSKRASQLLEDMRRTA